MNRDRFPGLSAGWVRLDGPAGSQVLDSAAAAVHGYLSGPDVANLHAPFDASVATDELVADARASTARLLGASPDGLVFGSSMTALTAHFAAAVAATLRPGDEIVCTQLDHDANISPWLTVAAATGATVRFAAVDPSTLELPIQAVTNVLSARTRLVAVTAASNVVGTEPDLKQITSAAHEAGALVYVDAVHALPHGPLSTGDLGADAVVTSAYKWFGPHVAALWVRPNVLQELQPPKVRPGPETGPERWERGALPFELLAGIDEAARYLLDLDWAAVRRHEDQLQDQLLTGLDSVPRVRLLGAPRRRTATVAFTIDGLDSAQVAQALAEQKIAVGFGNFYAVELMAAAGLSDCVRVGALHYNDASDVERFLDAVGQLHD